jgi:hypothetical protein
MRIVLIKVTLELVSFGRNHGWFRKRPMALIRSSMSMIISFSITKRLGKASAARLARVPTRTWGGLIFAGLFGCDQAGGGKITPYVGC